MIKTTKRLHTFRKINRFVAVIVHRYNHGVLLFDRLLIGYSFDADMSTINLFWSTKIKP